MKHYDVIIVGAGPGGIFSAYELKKKSNLKVAVFETGHPLEKRKCPIDGKKIKTCIGCKPCSYVWIPSRKWKEGDCVEVSMPFGAHIDFAPDKMDVAIVDGAEKPFEPRWAGALMYGPLVMAAEDIHSWEDAEFTVEPDLSDVKLLGADAPGGRDGSLYSLEFHGKVFKPDYWQTGRSTHYLRLDVAGKD